MTSRVSRDSRVFHRLVPVSAIVLALAAVGFSIRAQRIVNPAQAAADDLPADCITRLLAAERAGDVSAYLDCFAVPQRDRLRATWSDAPPGRTAAELQSASAGLAGHALTDEKLTAANQASLVLERIYKDHTTRQTVVLSREDGNWRIAELSDARWQTPAIPYGAPVSANP